jgi:hypothetical protein
MMKEAQRTRDFRAIDVAWDPSTQAGSRALQQVVKIKTTLVNDGRDDGSSQYRDAGPDMQAGGRLVMGLTMS